MKPRWLKTAAAIDTENRRKKSAKVNKPMSDKDQFLDQNDPSPLLSELGSESFHFLSQFMMGFFVSLLVFFPHKPSAGCYFHWALDWSPSFTYVVGNKISKVMIFSVFFLSFFGLFFVSKKITKIQVKEKFAKKKRLRAPI